MTSRPSGARADAAKRRVASISVVVLALVVGVVAAPLLVPVALIADLVTAPRRLPTLRAYAFGMGYAVLQLAGLSAAFVVWVVQFGGRTGAERWIETHRRVQAWWTRSVFALAGATLGLRIELEQPEALDAAPALVFGRHVSYLDSLVSALLLGGQRGRELRFVMKRELMVDPCLDVFGHRLRNHFVDRHTDDPAAEIAAVGALASDLRPHTAVVVFPEGTRFSPAKLTRRLDELAGAEDVDPEVLAAAEALRNLLPPRPGGALAMLRAAPDADVITIGHVGFEGLDSLQAIWASVPFRRPVSVRAWRHPRSDIPTDDAERIRWLADRWVELDAWVTAELAARA